MQECQLDKIIFVPVGDYYEKEGLISAKDRIQMLKDICAEEKGLEVSDIETTINQKLYAIDVFHMLNEQYQSSNNYFIMGSDNYKNIRNWYHAEELLRHYQYIILDRNQEKENTNQNLSEEEKLKDHVQARIYKVIENSGTKNMSSTEAREKIKTGKNVEMLLKPQTIAFIKEKHLYK